MSLEINYFRTILLSAVFSLVKIIVCSKDMLKVSSPSGEIISVKVWIAKHLTGDTYKQLMVTKCASYIA